MSSMASTTASRAAAAEGRHDLRHEAADTAIAELKEVAAAAAGLLKVSQVLEISMLDICCDNE